MSHLLLKRRSSKALAHFSWSHHHFPRIKPQLFQCCQNNKLRHINYSILSRAVCAAAGAMRLTEIACLSLLGYTLLCYLGNNYFQLLDSVVLNRLLIGGWVSDLPWEIITQCVFGFVENKLNHYNDLKTNGLSTLGELFFLLKN
jgi:hypothetical protein